MTSKRTCEHGSKDRSPSLMSRRAFVEGLVAGGVVAGLGLSPAAAATGSSLTVLRGTHFVLTVAPGPVDFTGKPGIATLINGSLPGPELRWREGDTVSLQVRNHLTEDTSIHWHGILLPANMDGVPGLSFPGIPPGGTYLYQFQARQSGTYWYHSHSGFQEQTGVYGPLVIEPREAEPFAYDRDYVIMLSEWTDMDPRRLFALLHKQSDYFNYNRPTLGDFLRDVKRDGFKTAMQERLAWAAVRMSPADLADVSGHTYTYLMNGRTPAGNWTGLFRPGERVRLRFINGSSMTYFDVRIPGLPMTVVAVDGQNVHPVSGDEIRIGVAETFDVIVQPGGADAFTIFAQSMDRSGYARGTLATRYGLSAAVPQVDRIVYLTMADMGHGGADHGGVGGPSESSASEGPAAHEHRSPPVGHADHAGPSSAPLEVAPHPSSEPAVAAQARSRQPADHAGMDHGQDHPRLDHPPHDATVATDSAAAPPTAIQAHPASEYGNPGVDMRTTQPSARLDDPGVGLRNNGRRVLTYADFRSLFSDPDGREPGRAVELHLTGHMGRYVWSFDGIAFSRSEPIPWRYGERLRIVLVNDTMMEHPIHLHGMWSDLEDENGAFHLRKHTLSMPPGTRRTYRVTADALGRWAYHCHLLYHMEAGMFREVRVEE